MKISEGILPEVKDEAEYESSESILEEETPREP
jgi:hypothetical protein